MNQEDLIEELQDRLMHTTAENAVLRHFVRSLTQPEKLGFAVNQAVRDLAKQLIHTFEKA